jgi:diadenosine tetraphosphate (Ap4A) HIT family hydrolase
MSNNKECAFCDHANLEEQIIRLGSHSLSVISNPRFRPGQSLVIPNRHVTTVAELNPDESTEVMAELGRLSLVLDEGFGTGIMQKYQPRQAENGIKVNHLHFHVFPRHEEETNLFPTPEPNDFTGFSIPSDDEVNYYLAKLQ